MAYQKKWKPGKDFYTLVEPHLDDLPKDGWTDPLLVEYPLWIENKAKWQWYNWMHHFGKGQFSIKINHPQPQVVKFEIRSTNISGIRSVPQLDGFEVDDELEAIAREFLDEEEGDKDA